jgi:hypothetical protein
LKGYIVNAFAIQVALGLKKKIVEIKLFITSTKATSTNVLDTQEG